MSRKAVDTDQSGARPRGVQAPLRGRGGPQLSPDAFAPVKNGHAEELGLAPSPARAVSARAVASTVRMATVLRQSAGRSAHATFRHGRALGQRTVGAATKVVADARVALQQRFQPPLDILDELETNAQGRTISNRIEELADLDAEEIAFIRDFAMSESRPHQAGADIVVERERAPKPAFITSGWACRARILSGGRRQIIGFLLPGDAIGLRGQAEPDAVTSITALTSVSTVDAGELVVRLDRSNRYPGLERAIQRVESQEKDFLINQISRLGFMAPHERLSDLLRELKWRLQQSGLANQDIAPLPIDRRTIGSALGLKEAQVKGAMRQLAKSEGFRLLRKGVALPDREWPDPSDGGFRPPPACRSLRTSHQPRIVAGNLVARP